jgi:hypothetical protein
LRALSVALLAVLRLQATRVEDLERITREVHDWFFDVDDVKFDTRRSEVVVPFRRWSTDEARVVDRSLFRRALKMGGREWEAPWYRWMFRIGEVTSCEVVDRAEIGSADFNRVEFDADGGVVTIKGNIPVTISAVVRRLDVSVEETDEAIGLARYTTWPGGAASYTGNVLPLP